MSSPHSARPAARHVNALAVPALISSFFIGVLGMALAHRSLSEIRASGEGGRGLAIAALTVGYLAISLTVVLVLLYVGAAAAMIR